VERSQAFGLSLVILGLAGCSSEAPKAAWAPSPDEKPVIVRGSPSRAFDNHAIETQETVILSEESPGELVTTVAPPALRVEVIRIETRPGPTYAWIPGHWAWRDQWVWVPGHWHPRREACHWVSGHWEWRNGQYRWFGGNWVEEVNLTEERPGLVIATAAPPALLQEEVHIELRPSPQHVWIYGHWAWYGHWVWVHGHWHVGRPGFHWTKGYWYAREGQWRWVAGNWTEERLVTEERPGLAVATCAPPMPYQERVIIETRPAPDYTWIYGHWAWHGHWVWEHGHWQQNRPGHLWVQGRWVERQGRWEWNDGNWVQETMVTEERPGIREVIVEPPPPQPEVEVIELRPSPRHVWLAGHWSWHGHWVWEHGHWHLPPQGNTVWVSGRWESRSGHWLWTEGRWR
jgi:hypothetical protein